MDAERGAARDLPPRPVVQGRPGQNQGAAPNSPAEAFANFWNGVGAADVIDRRGNAGDQENWVGELVPGNMFDDQGAVINGNEEDGPIDDGDDGPIDDDDDGQTTEEEVEPVDDGDVVEVQGILLRRVGRTNIAVPASNVEPLGDADGVIEDDGNVGPLVGAHVPDAPDADFGITNEDAMYILDGYREDTRLMLLQLRRDKRFRKILIALLLALIVILLCKM